MTLLLLALAPVILVIVWIYFKDKFDKEPKELLFRVFIMGVTISVLITFCLGYVLGKIFPVTDKTNVLQHFLDAFLVVALVEEFSKYVIVRFVAQPHAAFDEKLDGIVYAVMASMGFAALENVIYVFQYGYETAFIRAFTAVPAHATFAVLMGYFMGKAKFSKNKKWLNLTGLLLAIVFHGAYDFFLFIHFIPGTTFGAVLSLFIGVILSQKAINAHQRESIFRK